MAVLPINYYIYSCMEDKFDSPLIIKNNNGLDLALTSLGASIYSIKFCGELMTLTPQDYQDFAKDNIYYGKTIGPIPNRLKNGRIVINRKAYQLNTNEDKNTLHSSNIGLHQKMFDYEIVDKEEMTSVIFYYQKKNMEDNLPGNVSYTIQYDLYKKENILVLQLIARSDKNTVMGLTNHTYFSLGQSHLDGLTLTIPSHYFIETGKEDLLPLKERKILPCLDFNEPKRIEKDIDDPYLQNHRSLGYDHCFLLNKGNIKLENNKYILDIQTDFPAVQIYSDNYVDNIKMMKTDETNHRGIAIEPQDNLLKRIILKKGSIYHRTIKYRFYQK